jgi:hypothetical protein
MDDQTSSTPAILCSDAERARAIEVLRSAVVDGRLTLEEFSQRVDSAQTARTDRDLTALVSDLPQRPFETALDARSSRRTVLFSQLVQSGPGLLPARSRYRCLVGTLALDLAQARLGGPDALIEVFNLFGTVTVTVPDGVTVNVEGGGLFANQLIERPPTPPLPHAPQLQIRVSGPGGTLYVRYAAAASVGERRPTRYL